jgi:hypothetical protein
MNDMLCILLTGAGATLSTDLWAIARRRFFGVPPPNYGLVGRWIGHLARGHLRHDSIASVPRIRGERVIGSLAHYAIGIAFALILPAVWGVAWIREPTLLPALAVGIVTVAAPFLIMQPGMGAGIAASRTSRPGAARLQSLATHVIYGLGLYLAGLLVSKLLNGG